MARFDPRIAIAAVVGLIVQIGVTIFAWGDWNSFFAHPARRELVVASVLPAVVACFSGTSGLSSGKSSSPQSKRTIFRFIFLFLAMTIIPPYCDRRDFWTTDGIYKHVRHPSYTGLLVAMIGWVLVFRSTIGLVLNIILFLLLLSRMADEEKFLEAEFGDEYRAYREKTRRLVPFMY